MTGKSVIVDTDPALGVRWRDVDDGLALLMLLATPAIDLRGITITFGNVKAPVGAAQAKDLLTRVGVEKPIHEGAHSRHDRGKATDAVKFLIDTVRDHPGEISLLAIGPLTNVATAMKLDPEFASRLRELVVMGGGLDFGWISSFGEFNFKCDPVSAARVLAAPIRKTLITLDVISHAIFRRTQLDQLRSAAGEVPAYLAQELEAWMRVNRFIFPRARGFYPWDPVAVAYLTKPELFDSNPMQLELATRGIRAGKIETARRLASFDETAQGIPINVPLELDGEEFLSELMQALLSFAR